MQNESKWIDPIYLDRSSYYNFTNWMGCKVAKLKIKFGKRKCIHCDKKVMNHYIDITKSPNEFIPACVEVMETFPKNSSILLTSELDLKKLRKRAAKITIKKRNNKPSIYLPNDCLDILDKIIQKEGYESYSKAIQDLIRNVKK